MDHSTILLMISFGSLLAALCLLWMRPTAKPKGTSASTLSIDLKCDAKDTMRELRAVTAELKLIAALAEKNGIRLDVKQMPPESARLNPAAAKPRQSEPSRPAKQQRRDGGKARSGR